MSRRVRLVKSEEVWMRRSLIAANWKTHGSLEMVGDFVKGFASGIELLLMWFCSHQRFICQR
jgi:hypothetical protein